MMNSGLLKRLTKILIPDCAEFFFGCCLLLSANTLMADGGIPIFRVDTADKSGREIGQELGTAFKQHFPDIEKRYDAYLSTFITQPLFNKWLQQRVQAVKPQIKQAYREEVEGIASRWQITTQDQLGDGLLSLNEYWFLLLIPDVGRQTNCSGFGVWGKASKSGQSVVGRNMDWHTNSDLRSLQAITVYHNKQGGMVNIGFAGYVGIISGFNQDGLYLAHLDSPLLQAFPNETNKSSIIFDLRQALETYSSIKPTSQYLARYAYSFSHNILMADPNNIKVLEQPQGLLAHLRDDKSRYRLDKAWNRPNQIAVVNCYVLADSPGNCFKSQDILRWERFKALAKFGRDNQADISNIIQIMFDRANSHQEIFNANTVQSMVYTPSDGKLRLYAAPVSGMHPDVPHMLEFDDLLPEPDAAMEQWLNILNLLIIASATLLIAVFVYIKKYSALKS